MITKVLTHVSFVRLIWKMMSREEMAPFVFSHQASDLIYGRLTIKRVDIVANAPEHSK